MGCCSDNNLKAEFTKLNNPIKIEETSKHLASEGQAINPDNISVNIEHSQNELCILK